MGDARPSPTPAGKEKTMAELKDKILAQLQEPVVGALATLTEEGKPWARFVTVFADQKLLIRCATFVRSRKVAQIKANPEVHLTAAATDLAKSRALVQVQGRAEVLTDHQAKAAVWFEDLRTYFDGPQDPNLAVVLIRPYRIEYQTMGSMEPEVWTA
jgi:general stress protein 26